MKGKTFNGTAIRGMATIHGEIGHFDGTVFLAGVQLRLWWVVWRGAVNLAHRVKIDTGGEVLYGRATETQLATLSSDGRTPGIGEILARISLLSLPRAAQMA